MQLVFYIGTDVIDSVALDNEKLSIPGYLGAIKRDLKDKYNELIQSAKEKVEFLVVEVGKEKKVAKVT
jgi:hypothetical protein